MEFVQFKVSFCSHKKVSVPHDQERQGIENSIVKSKILKIMLPRYHYQNLINKKYWCKYNYLLIYIFLLIMSYFLLTCLTLIKF